MTSKLTRERIELIANFHRAMTLPPSHAEIEELARMALAAMDSEPVAYISKSDFDAGYPHILARRDFNKACTMPVYAAQPAPVVPEEKPIPNTLSMYAVDAVAAIAEVKGWNACRAALLERQLVDRVDEKSLTSINPASDLVSLQKKAESIIGNYPGIPDGYVMVPKEPTKEILDEFNSIIDYGAEDSVDAWRRLLAAAPQSPGSEPATVPGKWIPVSEQMPPSRHEVLVGRWWGEKPLWCCKWATYIHGHPDAQSSGWLIPGASWTPTHWMPLPAAPQEVK
ncbi:DUF551 domain-containing protein [Klebsiella pneumoniae]|nr:DUF551 domain-containing protein [Klebsiella pneumoniae]WLY60183.1 DUF551 domain-containing protein [Klebsiella pneumoniae]